MSTRDPAKATAGETEGRPSSLPQSNRCPNCGAEAPSGMNFCRSCGGDLRALGPTERQPSQPGIAEDAATQDVRCPRCRAVAPSGHMFCPSCGAQLPTLSGAPTPDEVRRITAGREEFRTDRANPETSGKSAPVVRSGVSVGAAWGRLVSVNRDGTDGTTYHLSGDTVDVGSGRVDVRVTGDLHVADRHVRFEHTSGAVKVVPLDELNGVLWRVREPTEILSGTEVLLGREVCRIDVLAKDELEVQVLYQHGVALFASPVRKPWGRLKHIWANGCIGDVRHFFADEVVVGREEGDIIFADDEFMSRRHAVFRRRGDRCILEDLGSSNGTFVRLDGPTLATDGDYFRVGDP